MTLEDWETKAQHFEFEGLTVRYIDEGAGEALVCIHGFPTCSWDWHKIWEGLTRR